MIFFGILIGILICSLLHWVMYETNLASGFETFIKVIIFSSLFSVISYGVAIYSMKPNKETQKIQPKVVETEL